MKSKRRSLKELACDPRFISGIHNYCDRWCERCPLTSRFLVYAVEQQQDAEDPAARDVDNQAFWKRLEAILVEAREMLQDLMKEHGIEIEPEDLEKVQARERQRDDERRHPCAVAGSEYAKAVGGWFGSAHPRLQERGEMLASQLRMALPSADPHGDARRLGDATAVIQWYQHQIVVKIMRAIGSVRREEARDLCLDGSDADGSAKVAMIGIDRSLAAWSELLRQLPDEEDRILSLLAALSRLSRDVEVAFPGARAFVRPGFDTGDAAGV